MSHPISIGTEIRRCELNSDRVDMKVNETIHKYNNHEDKGAYCRG